MKLFLIIGAINAMLAVALGAFGAHGLEGKISEKYLEVWKTGVQYQMFHAMGLFVIAFLLSKFPQSSLLTASGWIMFAGIVLFSGSLYVLSTSGIKVLGAITPLGGVAFIVAWILIVVAAVKWL
ncbi:MULTISPECIES: DUF423 domain-containing protein [Priestia]|mgnify:CR=1 FL=1|jgi:uncharacterized membrane protein YgdD (TMEM256/DUF423 family)|uniref:DUF423 domain-containing protein n=6 Tax=Bacillati TaxID=1783272 RepID=D5DWL8_PRIM1|nr:MULTISPECIES: DUF423 domain-containing protein [Priestia]AVX11041.1 DUF423 domain-containing protein [Bacillus sp. Y-01]KQU18097.1 hypothetical protein ASG61_07290 [Bacillus sp. Leaf75]KRD83013.1 hypothetical protein ASE51_21475 [Bacillus sp. Root147]KRD95140.1 hypothetical protein ASE46_16810 [Bacillus sp. Root239]KRF47426.1 hypothetical protein ASG98_15465 [Bacillus sp. Soil531]MBK0009281.1 DUF423 domain-containing protein [Bacillus sp. S35]MBK0294903.1 DUF423 domain-containing protein 